MTALSHKQHVLLSYLFQMFDAQDLLLKEASDKTFWFSLQVFLEPHNELSEEGE